MGWMDYIGQQIAQSQAQQQQATAAVTKDTPSAKATAGMGGDQQTGPNAPATPKPVAPAVAATQQQAPKTSAAPSQAAKPVTAAPAPNPTRPATVSAAPVVATPAAPAATAPAAPPAGAGATPPPGASGPYGSGDLPGGGSWWDSVTGKSATDIAAAQAAMGAKVGATVANSAYSDEQAAREAEKQYDNGLSTSMGKDAADYMAKADAAAQGEASQAAMAASTQAGQQAARTARTMGLNPGEAALTGGQAVGDAYTNNYQQGLASGRQQYQAGTSMFGAAGDSRASRKKEAQGTQLGAGNLAAGISSAQGQQGAAQGQGFWNTIANVGGAILGV